MRKMLPLLLASLPFAALAADTETPANPAPPVTTTPPTPAPIESASVSTSAPFWQHEIEGNASATFGVVGNLAMTERHYSFYGSGGYAYALSSNWQLGGALGFFVGKSGATYGGGSLLVGPTFNFTGREGIQNALFISLRAGLRYFHQGGSTDSQFMGELALGKRWAITDSVSYKPYVSANVTKYSDESSLDLNIVPLSFSFGF